MHNLHASQHFSFSPVCRPSNTSLAPPYESQLPFFAPWHHSSCSSPILHVLAAPLGRAVNISWPTRWEGGWIYPSRPVLKAYDISQPTCWEGVWIYLGQPTGKGGGYIPADPF